MAEILSEIDSFDPMVSGGKAASLSALRRAGFEVPDFFAIPPNVVFSEQELGDWLLRLGSGPYAVRSSSRDEDGVNHSFAGQFATFLDVAAVDIAEKIAIVRASASAEAILLYAREKKIPPLAVPAVLIMPMLDARAAGVCFSADPVGGRRALAVLSACEGTGEKLVSGEVDGEDWKIFRKGEAVGQQGVISADDAKKIADLAWRCERHYMRPQDIEWAIDRAGKLWLLQSRPITTLGHCPDPDDTLRVFDNSNIAESYSGITTPMTFSFAQRIYESVYREFCFLLGVPHERIAAADDVFPQMLGMIRGRVYYNLLSWYRVLALLPGFNVNRTFMEQMMGVKEPLPKTLVQKVVAENERGRLADKWHLFKTCLGLLRGFFLLENQIKQFRLRLSKALDTPLPQSMDGEAMAADYRRLEGMLLKKWDAPLVNDFFAMIFHGLVRGLCGKWFASEPQLVNDLMADCGEIISAEPPRRICQMAEMVAKNSSLTKLLASRETPVAEKIRGLRADTTLAREWDTYLQRFGDRCLEELKLESLNVADDPYALLLSLGLLAQRGVTKADSINQVVMRPNLPWWKDKIFCFVLTNAQRLVRNRENLRFERTRLFGRVRALVSGMGRVLYADGTINEANDVFYLNLNELLAVWDGTGTTSDLRGLIAARKSEYAGYQQMPEPPDRIVCHGPLHRYEEFPAIKPAVMDDALIQGVGACGGIVRGKVRVVLDPRQVEMAAGEIIVARQTDPGWVVLFPSAAGLLVERGSLLSHSAIVSRELRLPCIVSLPNITQILKNGDEIEMNGGNGTVRML